MVQLKIFLQNFNSFISTIILYSKNIIINILYFISLMVLLHVVLILTGKSNFCYGMCTYTFGDPASVYALHSVAFHNYIMIYII